MTRRIFRAVLSVSFLVCIVGMVTVFMILFHYFDGQLTKELSSEAKYLALSVENYGMQALEDLPDNSERVTLVAPDGRVLFDNHADPDKMDNHANREEIVEAMKNGSAKAVRRSDTIQKSNSLLCSETFQQLCSACIQYTVYSGSGFGRDDSAIFMDYLYNSDGSGAAGFADLPQDCRTTQPIGFGKSRQ